MIVTVVQFVFPFDESRLHPIDMHLVGNNARRIVARQLRLMNRRKIRHSLSRDIRQVDVAGLRICAILWTAEYNSVLIGIACAMPDNKLCRSLCHESGKFFLAFWPKYLIINMERMGRDSNPRCLSAHTLSRRAQSTTLSPIHYNLALPLNLNLSRAGDNRNRARLRGSGRGRPHSCERRNNSSSGNWMPM